MTVAEPKQRKKLKGAGGSALAQIDNEIADLKQHRADQERQTESLQHELGTCASVGRAGKVQEQIAQCSSRTEWIDARIAALEAQRDEAAAADAKPIMEAKLRESNEAAEKTSELISKVESTLQQLETATTELADAIHGAHAARTTAIGLAAKHCLAPPADSDLHRISSYDRAWIEPLGNILEKVRYGVEHPSCAGSTDWLHQLRQLQRMQKK